MNNGECVVALHGLGRTANSMNAMASTMRQQGFMVWNESYPSRQSAIAQLAGVAIEPALTFCREKHATRIHFVTHSLGGILLRQYLQKETIENLGRIVMISPPNHGSEIVDTFGGWKIFQWYLGPAGRQLGTGADDIPKQLKPIAAEIGVITGTRSSDPWFNHLIPGEHDGKVSVASARLTEMRDFLTMPYGHTFIASKAAVIEQCSYFFIHGRFKTDAEIVL